MSFIGNGKWIAEVWVWLFAILAVAAIIFGGSHLSSKINESYLKNETGFSLTELASVRGCAGQFMAVKSEYSEKFGTGTNLEIYKAFAARGIDVVEIGGGVGGTDPSGIKTFVKTEKNEVADCSVAFVNSWAVSEFRFCDAKRWSPRWKCVTLHPVAKNLKERSEELTRMGELSDKFVPPKENDYKEVGQ